MSLRDIQEKAKNAHTFGTATLTNKIERMHRNAREKQVVTFDISACEVDHLLSTTRERLPKPNRIIYRLVVDTDFFGDSVATLDRHALGVTLLENWGVSADECYLSGRLTYTSISKAQRVRSQPDASTENPYRYIHSTYLIVINTSFLNTPLAYWPIIKLGPRNARPWHHASDEKSFSAPRFDQ